MADAAAFPIFENLFKMFSKKLLTVGNLLHIWLFTDGTRLSGTARLRLINR